MGKSTSGSRGTLLIALLIATGVYGQSETPLVIGITVDQMKAEYLNRFDEHFTGGFRRLLDRGTVFRNNHYNHVPTYTAPGHATIYTGAQPGDHGIISNDWYDPLTGKTVYCVEDSTVLPLGGSGSDGQMSPRNLKTTTFTDELKLFSNGRAYVGSVSIKDRGAILPGGHAADEAYWFSSEHGFISSSYYAEELPEWVRNFNRDHEDLSSYVSSWDLYLPEQAYSSCLPDHNNYEADLEQDGHTGFPVDLPALIKKRGNGMVRVSPWGNTLVTDFALEMLEHVPEGVLKDRIPDVFCLSYSSTDYVGHAFGPRSREVMDTYLRLDAELERLFNYLDLRVGSGNYVVFLTADHGVAENPTHMADFLGMQTSGLNGADVYADLSSSAVEALNFNPIAHFASDQIYLNRDTLAFHNVSIAECASALQEAWKEIPYLKRAIARADLSDGNHSAYVYRDHTREKRSGDLFLEYTDGNLIYGHTGSSHGSGYTYDTHVPMILMGGGIAHRDVYRKTHVTDLAPTLSLLLGIPLPHSAFSTPLTEVL